ncbi:hypothetical protein [Bradyrhizobium sp. STM 3562]|uniref:hypothetical protein n=1 Tax=Bradyrhizobium sp. STM 3562 TaxID=578924 RepID=UPI00388F6718
MPTATYSELEFVRYAAPLLPHMMWFLGAGASRTAGMPTATDIIWDLKRRYYCLRENQDVRAYNINNNAVREKLQNYMDSKGFPSAGTPDEYSFYFSLSFADNLAEQQRYLSEVLSPDKISLNMDTAHWRGCLALDFVVSSSAQTSMKS